MVEYVFHLAMMLDVLLSHSLHVKLSKCKFARDHVNYLGHIVSTKGVQVDDKKIEAILSWPKPVNVKQLREALGLSSYYWKFVWGYGQLASPLTNLLKQEAFVWGVDQDLAFE